MVKTFKEQTLQLEHSLVSLQNLIKLCADICRRNDIKGTEMACG